MPDYITPNQIANMIEKRANELDALLTRIEKNAICEVRTLAALRHCLTVAIDRLDDAQGLLRGGLSPEDVAPAPTKSPAQLALEAHRPGLPPGGGQPDLF